MTSLFGITVQFLKILQFFYSQINRSRNAVLKVVNTEPQVSDETSKDGHQHKLELEAHIALQSFMAMHFAAYQYFKICGN
jgi:hypothetical protein